MTNRPGLRSQIAEGNTVMNRVYGVLSTCLFVLVFATVAVAQSDVMCFCADNESESTCGGNIDLAAFTQQTIYLCVVNPSQSQALGWQAYIEVAGEENMSATWQILGESALNFASSPEYQVGTALSPLTPNSANVIPLLSISVLTFNEDSIRFYIKPVPGSLDLPDNPGYASDVGMVHPCSPCGADDLPSFTINSAAEDEPRAWGDVKTIYGD